MFGRLFYLFSTFLLLATCSVIGQHSLYGLEDRLRQDQLLQNLLESSNSRNLRVENWLQTHQKNRYFRDSLGAYYTLFDVIANQYPLYQTSANSTISNILQTSALFPNSSFNLRGNGIKIGLWEAGNQAPLETHEQISGRIYNPDSIPIGNHATWMAGTLIASGNGNTSAKGMAPEATITISQDNNKLGLLDFGINEGLISNHSYQTPVGWLYNGSVWRWWGDLSITQTSAQRFGQYSIIDQEFDEISRATPYHIIVKAAGNLRGIEPPASTDYEVWDGNTWITLNTDTAPREKNGGIDGYDCIPIGAIAKNILTVGGVTKNQINGFYENMNFSGWGPADDGRIKPDLVAPGSNVISTSSSADNAYGGGTGTSFSTAAISGSLALIQEMMIQKSNKPLLASTLKGLAIHTANSNDSITGPNYRTGWGLLNTEAAAELIENLENGIIIERDLEQGEEFVLRFLNEGNKKVKATICWTDPESPLIDDLLNDRRPRLVNDLDIRLIHNPDSTTPQVFFPWKLNPINPAAPAVRTDNIVDNVEVVEPDTSLDGIWEIRVTHKDSLSDGQQRFSLILEGIPFEWNATSVNDTLWSAPGNWKGNNVPPENAWVYIGTGKSQLTIDSTYEIGALSVNENADVIIYGELEVNGDIHNRGNVSIKDGQLKWNGSYWGEIDYLRSRKNNWVSIGTPTSNTIANQLGNVSPLQGNSFSWNANDAEWVSLNPTDTLKPGTGHLVFYGTNGVDSSYSTIHLNGIPNHKAFFNLEYNDGLSSSTTLTIGNGKAGWNLLSNPFTSSLDFSTWFFTDFDLENAFYIWNSIDEEYQAYTPAVNGILTPHIAPLQGFWVQKKSNTPPTLLPSASIRKHTVLSTTANFLSDDKPFNTLVLVLENNIRSDSTFLVFIDGTSNQHDSGWDAWKLPSKKLDLATREGNDYLSINAVNVPNPKSSIEVHVYSEIPNIAHEFRLNTRFLSADFSVWLEDKQLEHFVNLKDTTYVFTIDTNQITGRFILHYGTLNLDREDFIFNDKNKDLFLYHFANELHLHAVNQDFKDLQIDVFHSGGQKVFTSNIQKLPVGSQEVITLPKLPSGLYVAVVNNGRQHIKFIIP